MVNFNGDPHTHTHSHPPQPHDNNHFNHPNGHNGNAFPNHDYHQHPNNHYINPLDSGYPPNPNPNTPHSMPRPPRKRAWSSTPPDQVDGVKVYVAPVPRTSTEADIRLVFEGHGTIVEVVLLKDKRTGARQGSCFVKYATLDEADRAIKALNNQYTFAGELSPVVVRFADRELERLGFGRNLEKKDPSEGKLLISPPPKVADKVFVSFINREASEKEIEEIFSTYGHVEDVFIAHSRGYAFVKYSNREMALAAIKGLNMSFTMRGCDHPLIVRFADPKKPKTGESRGNCFSGNANFGPCSQEPAVWPVPSFGDPNIRGSMLPIAPHHSTIPHPQVASNRQNWQPGANVVQQPFPPQQPHSQLASMPLQSLQAPKLSSQPLAPEVQRQSHPADSPVQNIEQKLSSQLPTQSGSNPNSVAGTASPDMPTSPQDEEFPACDWSEHYCPDGHTYYYNCVTCESRWEKPEEYTLYEKESEKREQEDNSCLISQLSLSSAQQVAQSQQETNHDHGQSETSPIVAQGTPRDVPMELQNSEHYDAGPDFLLCFHGAVISPFRTHEPLERTYKRKSRVPAVH